MALAGRDLVTIDDLSNGEINAIFSAADEMSQSMKEQLGLCRGKIMATPAGRQCYQRRGYQGNLAG